MYKPPPYLPELKLTKLMIRMQGHGAAGEGQSWQPAGGDRAANQRAKSSLGAPMRRTNETLPEGFLSAISHTHVGKQVFLCDIK